MDDYITLDKYTALTLLNLLKDGLYHAREKLDAMHEEAHHSEYTIYTLEDFNAMEEEIATMNKMIQELEARL